MALYIEKEYIDMATGALDGEVFSVKPWRGIFDFMTSEYWAMSVRKVDGDTVEVYHSQSELNDLPSRRYRGEDINTRGLTRRSWKLGPRGLDADRLVEERLVWRPKQAAVR